MRCEICQNGITLLLLVSEHRSIVLNVLSNHPLAPQMTITAFARNNVGTKQHRNCQRGISQARSEGRYESSPDRLFRALLDSLHHSRVEPRQKLNAFRSAQ